VRLEIEFEENEEEHKRDEVQCELIDDDIAKADGNYFVSIVGIESKFFDGIESGVSTLVADGAVFLDGSLQIPQGATVEIGSIDDYIDKNDETGSLRSRRLRSRQNNRRLGAFGKRRVLVVRADAYDKSTSADMATLSNNIFGTSGDSVTLKSQYEECSHGQLTFIPYDESGVIEVELEGYVEGSSKFNVQDAMVNAASSRFGYLPDEFDHVMLCMPPGTGSWIAYAYVNSWLSVFNDDWCQQLSTQVHEVGHNLGLAHSGKGGDDYADKSGMMGYSFKLNDAPLQCFNPAKSYDLGWYENSVVEWDPLTQGTWFGNIEGVVDYDENSNTQTVIVKINRDANGRHLYIGYNRKKEHNSGVVDQGDKVVIIEVAEGYKVSNFVEGLHPRSSVSKKIFYNFEDEKRNLVVDFSRYGDSDSVEKAFVAIYFDDCSYPECCEGEMCDPQIPKVSFYAIFCTVALYENFLQSGCSEYNIGLHSMFVGLFCSCGR
jgi:hypothetical protein